MKLKMWHGADDRAERPGCPNHALSVGRCTRASRGAAALALLAACTGLAGCGGSPTLAKVGGTTITDAQFIQDGASQPAGGTILGDLIVKAILDQEGKAQGVTPTDAQVQDELARAEKNSPALAQSLSTDRESILGRIRVMLTIYNLLEKQEGVNSTSVQKWWEQHRSVFDQPATISVVEMIFDTPDKATKAESMLKSGTAPKDVVAALGDPGFSTNGITSPQVSRDQILAQMPGLATTVDKLFDPTTKPGYATPPLPNTPQAGKTMILQLVARVPAVSASVAANQVTAERYMAAESYIHKQMPTLQVPPQPTAAFYMQVLQAATGQFMANLAQQYMKAGKITVDNAALRKQIDAQFRQVSPTGGPGAAPPGAGAPPPGAEGNSPTAPGPAPAAGTAGAPGADDAAGPVSPAPSGG